MGGLPGNRQFYLDGNNKSQLMLLKYRMQKEEIIMDAKQVITNYHNAWTNGNMKTARLYLADDLDFQGSIDAFRKADDFVVALTIFQKMLRESI
ncbi:MAG: hypothetical protein MZV70_14290 [Desulfobacterales bacterium]|nr:hypothetical protein [Desulfobacterales bacterium]